MADRKLTGLANPDAAIASYLDELLHTATDTARQEEPPEQPPAAKKKAEPESVPDPDPVRVAPPLPAEPLARDRPVSVAKPTPVARAVPVARPEQSQAENPPETPASRPDWSGQPFECLIFRVAGLQMAVPLVLLGAIHRIDSPVRPMPGSPSWYMGILPGLGQNLRVVDSAEWIMAGRVPEGTREQYRFIIRLDDSDWGLACDDVAQSFTLKPDEVRWRTSRSKRPWLAGTVISQMCALIDVKTMADLLVRAEKEHHLAME